MSQHTDEAGPEGVRSVLAAVQRANRIVLTTHMNADGDGAGSQAAVASWLASTGREVWIINPTRFPDAFRFLLEDTKWLVTAGTPYAEEITARADLALVLDTAEVSRIGRVKGLIRHLPKAIVDHHILSTQPIKGTTLRDPSACATGELVYDMIQAAGDDLTPAARKGIYVAILTDTGGFRFSNATPKAHRIAAEMIEAGVDPEDMYGRVYGSAPMRRYQLLAACLQTLDVDDEAGIGWMVVPQRTYDQLEATAQDLDGFVDYPRTLEGVHVGLLFRETQGGEVKVSLRSSGPVDVNKIAREFGGGGHVKASGAILPGTIDEVRAKVVQAVRREALSVRGSTT